MQINNCNEPATAKIVVCSSLQNSELKVNIQCQQQLQYHNYKKV